MKPTSTEYNKEIIESNILIAKYLGGEDSVREIVRIQGKGTYAWDCAWAKRYKIDIMGFPSSEGFGTAILVENLLFHKEFNHLMPVVEGIEQVNYGFKMCRKVVEVYFDDTKELILKTKLHSRLESLYDAVVKFIKLQNNKISLNEKAFHLDFKKYFKEGKLDINNLTYQNFKISQEEFEQASFVVFESNDNVRKVLKNKYSII